MSDIVIKVEEVSKLYRLGEIGTGTISHDLNRWWASLRGKEDPLSQVGEVNDRTQKSRKDEYVWALKDINFELKRGEVLGIIGKNGAGKSTLLKLLSRITAPTKGEIKIKGRVASLLEVGTGMHPEMTGKENVYLNGTILGMTKQEVSNKLENILDFAGCLKYADTPVKRYSSGMKVRLGFAVAAFLEPEILIVDEVLAVGDIEFQKKAIGKMREISSGGGRTVLFVSHNMGSIQTICNKAILVEHGKIINQGSSSFIVSEYLKHAAGVRDSNATNIEFFRIKRKGLPTIARIVNFQIDSAEKLCSNMQFEILFQIKTDRSQSEFGIQIQVEDENGFIFFVDSMVMADKKFIANKDVVHVACRLGSLNLLAGEYHFTYTLFMPNLLLDKLSQVYSFEVLSTSNEETVYSFNKDARWGLATLNHSWTEKLTESEIKNSNWVFK